MAETKIDPTTLRPGDIVTVRADVLSANAPLRLSKFWMPDVPHQFRALSILSVEPGKIRAGDKVTLHGAEVVWTVRFIDDDGVALLRHKDGGSYTARTKDLEPVAQ